MGIALVEPQMGTLNYAGVGNIRLAIIRAGDSRSGGQYRRLVSDYGIVGAGFCRLTCETLSLAPDDLVLLFSDGIPESAPLGDCESDDPQHLAQEILDTWGRNSDDVAVMIFKCGGAAW